MRFMMRDEAGKEIDGPVASDGLQPNVNGARRRSRRRPIFTDGPFAETKEFIAGGAVAEVESREETIEWASPPATARLAKWVMRSGTFFLHAE